MTTTEMDAILEPRLQLHESVEIYYIVSDWLAKMTTADGMHDIAEAYGSTPLNALVALCEALKTTPAIPGAGCR